MEKAPQEQVSSTVKSAGRPKASELEARSQNLLHTAGQLLLKHGYGKTSLESIAREAHVAVRTIYTKFGGKAGLLRAVMETYRDQFYVISEMDEDTRPFKQVIDEFSLHYFDMINAPQVVRLKRIIIAEAGEDAELSQLFWETGPRQTRDMLGRYFARPEIRAQLREDAPLALLPTHLLNCIMGDQFRNFMYRPQLPVEANRSEIERDLALRLDLFYRSVLRTS